MRVVELIQKKRDGGELTRDEIRSLIEGYLSERIPDYQMAAFLMAVYFRHMSERETYYLTEIMAKSGEFLDLSEIPGPKVDKHSTGGVGDKTTLVVGPLVASCGLPFAKLSGRALGHTGGTIDKLESIPGFRTALSREGFIEQVRSIGIAIAGQTGKIAPADKKIYALRDSTATVDEVSLIASSIMSKKLSIGSDAIVLDVKVGSGAFMKDLESARKLARLLVSIGKQHDRRTIALITDMDQPLGTMVGNSLEVLEAVRTLRGEGPEDFEELCVNLAGWMLVAGGLFESLEEAVEEVRKRVADGSAEEKFREMVKAQGGDARVLDDPEAVLPISRKVEEIKASKAGLVVRIDAEKIGVASMVLGGGRSAKEDRIDHSVGVEVLKKRGERVEIGEPFARLYFSSKSELERARYLVSSAYELGEETPEVVSIIREVIE